MWKKLGLIIGQLLKKIPSKYCTEKKWLKNALSCQSKLLSPRESENLLNITRGRWFTLNLQTSQGRKKYMRFFKRAPSKGKKMAARIIEQCKSKVMRNQSESQN